jgi:NDP-sugar pyrophosphorylase family protein
MPNPSSFLGLILAGGAGTRMTASGVATPKPLLEVGGTPLLERLVHQLRAAGAAEIHVALHHRADEIRERLEPRLASVRWIVEDEPLGTIGVLGTLRGARRDVVALNGDLLTHLDPAELVRAHRTSNAAVTVATHTHEVRLPYGEVLLERSGRVAGVREKPVKGYRVASGAYAFAPAAVELVAAGEALGAPDLVARALRAGLAVRALHHGAAWIDVNAAADLAAGRRLFASSA